MLDKIDKRLYNRKQNKCSIKIYEEMLYCLSEKLTQKQMTALMIVSKASLTLLTHLLRLQVITTKTGFPKKIYGLVKNVMI